MVLVLTDPIHERNEKLRDSKYYKERALLNELQCIKRGAVTLTMKAVAAGLDPRASSRSSLPTPLPSSCFVGFGAKLKFVSR